MRTFQKDKLTVKIFETRAAKAGTARVMVEDESFAACPCTVLRNHTSAVLYCGRDSSSALR